MGYHLVFYITRGAFLSDAHLAQRNPSETESRWVVTEKRNREFVTPSLSIFFSPLSTAIKEDGVAKFRATGEETSSLLSSEAPWGVLRTHRQVHVRRGAQAKSV